MNKHLIVLAIVIISQFKNNNRINLTKKEITNFYNLDFIKNSKNHKRTFSTKIFQTISKIITGKNKKLIFTQKSNFCKKYFVKEIIVLMKKILPNFDFNSINLLFFGCCI